MYVPSRYFIRLRFYSSLVFVIRDVRHGVDDALQLGLHLPRPNEALAVLPEPLLEGGGLVAHLVQERVPVVGGIELTNE